MRFILLDSSMDRSSSHVDRRPSSLRTRGSRTGIQAIPKFRIRRFYGYVEFTDVFIFNYNLCLSYVRSPFYTIQGLKSRILPESFGPSFRRAPILRISTLVIWGFSKP